MEVGKNELICKIKKKRKEQQNTASGDSQRS